MRWDRAVDWVHGLPACGQGLQCTRSKGTFSPKALIPENSAWAESLAGCLFSVQAMRLLGHAMEVHGPIATVGYDPQRVKGEASGRETPRVHREL